MQLSRESVSWVVRLFPNRNAGPIGSDCAMDAAPGTPVFFISVAFKGLSDGVSLLFTILAGESISVAAKGLMVADCWRESNGIV